MYSIDWCIYFQDQIFSVVHFFEVFNKIFVKNNKKINLIENIDFSKTKYLTFVSVNVRTNITDTVLQIISPFSFQKTVLRQEYFFFFNGRGDSIQIQQHMFLDFVECCNRNCCCCINNCWKKIRELHNFKNFRFGKVIRSTEITYL